MTDRDVLVPRSLLRKPDRFGGRVEGDCLRGRPVWRERRLMALEPPGLQGPATMLLPRLVEAHCHLDKCHTLPLLGAVGGDLAAAIAAQAAVRETRDEANLADCAPAGSTRRGAQAAGWCAPTWTGVTVPTRPAHGGC